MRPRRTRLRLLAAAGPLLAGCLGGDATAIDLLRFALIPESVVSLAVTVASPESGNAMECTAAAEIRLVEGGAVAGTTATLLGAPFRGAAELTGPVELGRGDAEGALVEGVPPGPALVFAEGFGGDDRTVARACAGPVRVGSGITTEVELRFLEL